MKKPKVNFRQDRGSWVAKAATAKDKETLGWDRIPVIRKYNNGDFNWNREEKYFEVHVTVDSSRNMKTPAWWMLAKNDEWRRLIESGAPVMLRDGAGSDSGFGETSVGAKRGIFATDEVVIRPNEIKLKLVERLAECE